MRDPGLELAPFIVRQKVRKRDAAMRMERCGVAEEENGEERGLVSFRSTKTNQSRIRALAEEK